MKLKQSIFTISYWLHIPRYCAISRSRHPREYNHPFWFHVTSYGSVSTRCNLPRQAIWATPDIWKNIWRPRVPSRFRAPQKHFQRRNVSLSRQSLGDFSILSRYSRALAALLHGSLLMSCRGNSAGAVTARCTTVAYSGIDRSAQGAGNSLRD